MEQTFGSGMKNEKLTLIQKYWDEAKTKPWQQYHIDQFGKWWGEYKEFYSNEQIEIITNFKDGKYHGKCQDWWRDGTRWRIETHHFKKGYHGTDIKFKYGK